MLGLDVKRDTQTLKSLAGAASILPSSSSGPFDTSLGGGGNRRSHKFATQLAGRFFVSGAFEKATREKLQAARVEGPGAKKPKVAEEIFRQRQALEIREDAERLVELEEKLREIQAKKELRRRRDRERRRKKLEYTSACKIQRAVRYFFGFKIKNAVDTIIAFIRTNRASQAVAIGAWAAGVLLRFSTFCSLRFKERRRRRLEKEKAAFERWSQMQQVLTEKAAARESLSNDVVGDCIKQGFMRALTSHIKRLRVTAATQKTNVKQKKPTPVAKKGTPSGKGEAHLQFFLTEFDSGGAPAPSTSSPPLSVSRSVDSFSANRSPVDSRRPVVVDARNVPQLVGNEKKPPSLSHPASALPASQSDRALPSAPILDQADMVALLGEVEGGDADDEELLRRQRIQTLHDERQRRMLKERELRLAKLEQTKREKEAELIAKQAKELEDKERSEAIRKAWLVNYEAEQVAKARMFAKTLADKDKIRKQEEKELKQMTGEDALKAQRAEEESRKRPPVPKLSRPKKAPSPSQEELELKRAEEAVAVELKRKQQEELVARSQAALMQRLALKKQAERLMRQKEEEQEKQRAEQKARVAAEAQQRLQRALDLKLERDAFGGVDDKDGAFAADNSADAASSSKKATKGKTRKNKASHASLKVPQEQLAAVEEWNHGVLPARPDELGDGTGAGELDDFHFEEFILHASKAVIEKRPLTKSAPPTAPNFDTDNVRGGEDEAEEEEAGDQGEKDKAEEGEEVQHDFADMLDDEASHYDWLDAFQVGGRDCLGATRGSNGEGGLDADADHVSELGQDDEAEEEERTRQDSRQSVDEESHAVFEDDDAYAPSRKPQDENVVPQLGANVKHSKKHLGLKKGIKTGAKKKPPQQQLRIPQSLKETPFYQAYVKHSRAQQPPPLQLQQPQPQQQSVGVGKHGVPSAPSQKHKKGKVAELLEMVAKARKKLGHPTISSVPVEAFSDAGLSSSSVLQAPVLALSPRWMPPPQPSLEFFLNGRSKSLVAASSNKKKKIGNQQRESNSSVTYDYDIYEAQRSIDASLAFDSSPADDLLAVVVGGQEDRDDVEEEEGWNQHDEDEHERRLNEECDVLRQKLETQIGAMRETTVAGPLPSVQGGPLTASDALGFILSGGFENSAAARLLEQWAAEDAAQEEEST